METSQETNIKVPFLSKLAYGFGDVAATSAGCLSAIS